MRQTLMMVLAAMPMVAAAQVPAPAPRPPAPARAPAPPVAPRVSIEPKMEGKLDWDLDFRDFKYDIKFDTHDFELLAEDAMRAAREATAYIDREEVRRSVEAARYAMKEVDVRIEPFEFSFPGSRDRLSEVRPRRAWASEDPADSLYRLARETLIRGEYRRAAQMFNEVATKFPRSEYVVSSKYWEAFARYRSGTTEDLKQALRILDESRTTLASLQTNKESQVDVAGLRTRVLSALASRGDREAADRLRQEANQQSSCDPEEISVKADALSALGQMDAASALPVVRKILARRDECTRDLRRRALYVIGRQGGAEATTIILDVAKNDPESSVRSEALRWLPRVAGDNAVPQLEEMLRTSTNDSEQRAIVNTLNAMDSEASRRAVRSIIERADASERVRYEAINSFLRERDDRQPSAEDQNYIRGLYSKLNTPKLREAVLHALSRIETPENEQFLVSIVRNQGETPSLRAVALQRMGRMESASVTDIAQLYDIADTRSLREQVLRGLSQRNEDAAVDKMIEIARKDTDPQIRRAAINLLARSSNKRAQDFIKEIFER